MNGIKFGSDMGVSNTRWTYTSNNKNTYLNTDSVGKMISSNPVVKNSEQEKIPTKLKQEKIEIERRKYIRFSTYDYLSLEENIIEEIDFKHPIHDEKSLQSPKKLLQKAFVEIVTKYELASILAHLSEEIISNERKHRDGNIVKKDQSLVDNLVQKAELTKILLQKQNHSYPQTNEKKENTKLENQIKQIFITQRKLNNLYASEDFEKECINYIEKRITLIKANSRTNINQSKYTSNDFFNYKLKTSLL